MCTFRRGMCASLLEGEAFGFVESNVVFDVARSVLG